MKQEPPPGDPMVLNTIQLLAYRRRLDRLLDQASLAKQQVSSGELPQMPALPPRAVRGVQEGQAGLVQGSGDASSSRRVPGSKQRGLGYSHRRRHGICQRFLWKDEKCF